MRSPGLSHNLLLSVIGLAVINFSGLWDLLWFSQNIKMTPDQSPSFRKVTSSLRSSNQSSNQTKIAWLMSFPNSGTSYTSMMVRHATRLNTASNYGEEDVVGNSIPVFEDQPEGPFWTKRKDGKALGKPNKYILTKTHCGCRCEVCGPSSYIESTWHFRQQCLTGHRKECIGGKKQLIDVQYSPDRVAKAVHLIRDPFDNIVSRFHLELSTFKRGYNDTATGFRDFCMHLNDQFDTEERNSMFWPMMKKLRDIPCRADFFRYMEWHNLAFTTTEDLGIETLVVHYADYTVDYDATSRKILEFLELDAVAAPTPFIEGKAYSDYFTESEKNTVRKVLKELASQATWREIQRYM